jgi:chemotaxis signal transduction protein
MTKGDGAVAKSAGRAAQLQREFDRGFAEPPRQDNARAREDLLALRAGSDDCVIRLSAMRGLLARPTIVALPSPVTELLGLAGLRGALLPVFSLAALQGQPLPTEAPAWMILIEADGLVGLAFEELLGHVSLDRDEIAALPPTSDGGASRPDVIPQAARVGETLRPLVDVPSLVAGLRRRVGVIGAHNQE